MVVDSQIFLFGCQIFFLTLKEGCNARTLFDPGSDHIYNPIIFRLPFFLIFFLFLCSHNNKKVFFFRYTMERPRFSDHLEAIKFICKDFWSELFKKQIDNLKTNHRVSSRIWNELKLGFVVWRSGLCLSCRAPLYYKIISSVGFHACQWIHHLKTQVQPKILLRMKTRQHKQQACISTFRVES